MLELVDIVQIINTISSENLNHTMDLVETINALRKIFLDLFTALENNNFKEQLSQAACELVNRSKLILVKVKKEGDLDICPENELNDRVKDVSELITKLVENAYGLVNSCGDEEGKQMVKLFIF